MSRVAGLDPGRSKCGLVLVDTDAACVETGFVLPRDEVVQELERWKQERALALIVIGNGTGSRGWFERLEPLASVKTVEEQGTTLRARQRYWQLWPAQGWQRLLPEGLRMPPDDLDAVAALVMVEDHLNLSCHWPGEPPRFKSEPEP